MANKKNTDELTNRQSADAATIPFSVEQVIQQLAECKTEEEREILWRYLDQLIPTLNEAQKARVRAEFSNSLTESMRRIDLILTSLRNEHGLAA